MKFTRELSTSITIRNVAAGEIHIGDEIYRKTIALTTAEIIDDWQAKPISELAPEDFMLLLEFGPELIVLGTGERNIFAPKQVTFALARQGIGLEVMDTAAAARTFNVLAGEGRRVAALLYL
ncbi:MAG: MTH938/NDUFAF3 family protein [Gammaproteobacteria bacterium]|nr:MTH938/NDUFAF3 family protein [Gammaproteobacteria bacterium]